MSALRYIVIVLFAWLVPAVAKAQIGPLFKSIDELEIIAGPSLVSLREVKFTEYNRPKVGYIFGVGANWHLGKKTSISAKFLAERKGIRRFHNKIYYYDDLEQEHIGTSTDIQNLDYISLPISFCYSFGSKMQFQISSGLYAAHLYKAQYKVTYSWLPKQIVSTKKNFREFDWGPYMSFGYQIPFNNKFWLNLSIVSSYGIIDISFSPPNTSYEVAKNILIGINFSLKKRMN